MFYDNVPLVKMNEINRNEKRAELEVYKVKPFKEILDCLAVVNEEHTIELNEEGIDIETMCPQHVSLVHLNLPSQYFDTYIVEPDNFSVNMSVVTKALNKTYKNDSVTITYQHGLEDGEGGPVKKDEKLTLSLFDGSGVKRNKIIPCLDYIDVEIPTPKIFFKVKTRITSKEFKTYIQDMDGDHVTFEATEDELRIISETDYREVTPLPRNSDYVLSHWVEEPQRCTYTKAYLESFLVKAYRVAEVLTLEFSTDMPLKLDVEIPQGFLHFYEAPCIGV